MIGVYPWSIVVHCVLLDFAKAFDSVPHAHLLFKLSSLDIHGKLLQWIKSFLTGWFQRVVINGSFSNWLPVRSGVLQGSVLGSLLFLIIWKMLCLMLPWSCFADDVALYCEVKSTADCALLQEDLNNICSWTTKWQLHLNTSKCGCFYAFHKRKPFTYKYSINGIPLLWHSSVKYLGICIQSHLSWSNHCRMIFARANRSLSFLHHSLWGTKVSGLQTFGTSLVRVCMSSVASIYC